MTHAIKCPSCGDSFTPKRKDQKYCSANYRKRQTRNAARCSRSGEYRARNMRHYERAHRLAELIYSVPTSDRLGQMKLILGHIPNDAGLRNILTDMELLKAVPSPDGKKTIAQAASAYTQKFFGVSIKTYVQKVKDGTANEGCPVKRRDIAKSW